MLEVAAGASLAVAAVSIALAGVSGPRAGPGHFSPAPCTCECHCPREGWPGLCSPYVVLLLVVASSLVAFCLGALAGSCCPRAAVRHRVEAVGGGGAAGKGRYFSPLTNY